MARIRTVKPEFFRHADLYEAEKETGLPIRLAFAGLWTAADREGRFKWRPRELKLDCLPHDEVDFSRVLDALTTRGWLVRYAVNGVEYGAIPTWGSHQVINNRETASVIPPPRGNNGLTREARVADATATPLVQVQVEGKGREGEGKGMDSDANAPEFEKSSRKKVSKALPDSYQLSERILAYAVRLGLSNSEVVREHTKFCNHAKQTDRRCAEWEPAEETWMLGAAERLGKQPTTGSVAPDWNVVIELYKRTGHWSRWAGPDPESPACKAPPDLLEKHGLRTMQ
jgi:hypothetical protein